VLPPNQCCRAKAMRISYSKCVFVVCVIQQAKRMRCIILSSMVCLAVPYFSTLSHKQHDFREKRLVNIKCVFWFYLNLLSANFLSLRITERDVIISVHRFSCRVKKLEFFSTSFRNTQTSDVMKIHPVRVELFHVD
jgi:hypothetical protein